MKTIAQNADINDDLVVNGLNTWPMGIAPQMVR